MSSPHGIGRRYVKCREELYRTTSFVPEVNLFLRSHYSNDNLSQNSSVRCWRRWWHWWRWPRFSMRKSILKQCDSICIHSLRFCLSIARVYFLLKCEIKKMNGNWSSHQSMTPYITHTQLIVSHKIEWGAGGRRPIEWRRGCRAFSLANRIELRRTIEGKSLNSPWRWKFFDWIEWKSKSK